MPRQRDVSNVSYDSNNWTGVQDVSFGIDNATFENSGDASDSVQRIDVTGLVGTVSCTVKDPKHKRDIANSFFGGKTVTAAVTDLITLTAHGLLAGDKVRFSTTTTLPAGLSTHTTYFVISDGLTSDDFKVSATSGGSAVDITDTGTGTHTVHYGFDCVKSVEANATSEEITDSCESDIWLTHISVTKKKLEASVNLKGVRQALISKIFAIGDKGDLFFEVLEGSTTSGFADSSKFERFTLEEMTITGIEVTATHADLADATISFMGVGGSSGAIIANTTHDAAATPFEVNPGDDGSFVWHVSKAISTNNNVQNTLVNAVLISLGLKAEHGAHLERTFEFKAYSSDGSTNPLTVVEAA